MKNDQQKPQKKALAKYLQYSQAGLQFFAAVGLFTFGGIWLDKHCNTLPLFTLLGLALGFLGGLRALYLELYGRKGKRGKQKDEEGWRERSSDS